MGLKTIFMGTPEFAVPTLDKLINSDHDVVGVITSPDKRGGRGRSKLIKSDVKKYTENLSIPLLQPSDLRDKSFLKKLNELNADIQVVVAFRFLPKDVWNMPPLGTINLHASLLPDYRGAAPIQWAIMNGEKETGLTTFQLAQKIDTGDILMQESVPIYQTDNAEDLHDRLMNKGPDIVLETLDKIEDKSIQPEPQQKESKKLAPKLHKENTKIDFNQSVRKVYNFIRGLSPYPTAWTTLDGDNLKIINASIAELSMEPYPGKVYQKDLKLYVSCKNGWLEIHNLQLEGKKRMSAKDFLNGYQETIQNLGN